MNPEQNLAGGHAAGALLHVRPATQQIVVDAGKTNSRISVSALPIDALNREIQIEQQSALAIIPNHALDPEERCDSRTARHRLNMMQARRGIQNLMSCRKLHGMNVVSVFHHEFATVILLLRRQE